MMDVKKQLSSFFCLSLLNSFLSVFFTSEIDVIVY